MQGMVCMRIPRSLGVRDRWAHRTGAPPGVNTPSFLSPVGQRVRDVGPQPANRDLGAGTAAPGPLPWTLGQADLKSNDPKDVQVLIPGPCGCVTSHSKGNFRLR